MVLLFTPEARSRQRWWAVGCVGVVLALAAAYLWHWLQFGRWPTASTGIGWWCGVAAAAAMFFEAAIYPRKLFRTTRLFTAYWWMIAHIWVGLLTFPLTMFHTKGGFGPWWGLTFFLTWAYLAVFASGLWGVFVQQFLPEWMRVRVPSETIHSQIGRMIEYMRFDAQRLVAAAGGGDDLVEVDEESEAQGMRRDAVVVGSVRATGVVEGKVYNTRVESSMLNSEDREKIRDFLVEFVNPLLTGGGMKASVLAEPAIAMHRFSQLRKEVRLQAHPVVDGLEALCAQRRELHEQARLHFWLHNWLWVHLPFTAVLLVLLVVHIWTATLWR